MDQDRKRELLSHLVKTNNWQQVLVFTRTKHGANRLAEQLERDGIEADAIHGNKSQGARTRALKRFKDNELQVLVATDIAARGLDIEELPHVVNYDLPHVAEDYVHRIGRTGRAGASGEAVVAGQRRRPAAAGRDRAPDQPAHRAEGHCRVRARNGIPGTGATARAAAPRARAAGRRAVAPPQRNGGNGGGNRQQQNNRQERRHEPRSLRAGAAAATRAAQATTPASALAGPAARARSPAGAR